MFPARVRAGDNLTYKVVDTSDWTAARLDPYWPEIFAAMMKLKAKLPDDISISILLVTWGTQRRKLWLILDENDRFKAFGMTEVEINLATGERLVTLKDLAGDGIIAAREEICAAFEAYADREGINDRRIYGLPAWSRVTGPLGYEPHAMTLRKVVER